MSELIRTPAMIAGEINLIKEQVRSTALQASIEIGRRLQEAKGLVPAGGWTEWLQSQVDYSVRTAQNLMALAAECDAGRGAALEKFPYSKAVLLLSVPEDERDEFVADHDVDGMSVRELKKQLDELKQKNDELESKNSEMQISMDELIHEQESGESAAEDMREEITQLKQKLAAATDAVNQAREVNKGIQDQHRQASEKLRSDLKAAQDETAKAQRELKAAKAQAETEKKQLEKALKDAGQPVIQQVTPPDVEKELAELRAKLTRSQDEQALRATYELLRSTFRRLTEKLSELDAQDAATAKQFRGAFAKGLQLMIGELTGGERA